MRMAKNYSSSAKEIYLLSYRICKPKARELASSVSSVASLPDLQMAAFCKVSIGSVFCVSIFHFCLCILICSYQDTNNIVLDPI